MALTLTGETRVFYVSQNVALLSALAYGTGDGTGGGVSGAVNIPVKATDIVSVIRAHCRQSDAATQEGLVSLNASDWEGQFCGLTQIIPLIHVPASGWITSSLAANFDHNPGSHLYIPQGGILLGKPLAAVPQINVSFLTNTNTKTYRANVNFIIRRTT